MGFFLIAESAFPVTLTLTLDLGSRKSMDMCTIGYFRSPVKMSSTGQIKKEEKENFLKKFENAKARTTPILTDYALARPTTLRRR